MPASNMALMIDRFSTSFTPEGTEMTARGREKNRFPTTWAVKNCSMVRVSSKSVMVPLRKGRSASTFPGVRPIMR